jgi:hypothetical protein
MEGDLGITEAEEEQDEKRRIMRPPIGEKGKDKAFAR